MEVNEGLKTIQGLPAIEDGMPLSGVTRPAKDNYHLLGNPASSSDAAAALGSTCGRALWLSESLQWPGNYRPRSEPPLMAVSASWLCARLGTNRAVVHLPPGTRQLWDTTDQCRFGVMGVTAIGTDNTRGRVLGLRGDICHASSPL